MRSPCHSSGRSEAPIEGGLALRLHALQPKCLGATVPAGRYQDEQLAERKDRPAASRRDSSFCLVIRANCAAIIKLKWVSTYETPPGFPVPLRRASRALHVLGRSCPYEEI